MCRFFIMKVCIKKSAPTVRADVVRVNYKNRMQLTSDIKNIPICLIPQCW